MLSVCFPDTAPPSLEFEGRHREIRAHIGGFTKIRVAVEGDPIPETTWYKDGIALRPRGNVAVHSTDSTTDLEIRRATTADSGTYKLVATNEWGSTEAAFHIEVLG